MYKPTQKRWSESERRELICLWPFVPSLTLIAIKMNRSKYSVQAQATRMGLPRRYNKTGNSWVRWSVSELIKLEKSVLNHVDAENKIHIVKVADELNRSIDSVIDKLIEYIGDEKKVLSRCYAPLDMRLEEKLKAKLFDDRKNKEMRKCLICQKQFWSEGAYNRICESCKRANLESESVEHSINQKKSV